MNASDEARRIAEKWIPAGAFGGHHNVPKLQQELEADVKLAITAAVSAKLDEIEASEPDPQIRSTRLVSKATMDAAVKAEREACAKRCECVGYERGWQEDRSGFDHGQSLMRNKCAAAIRARSETGEPR
jgi:D-tyrosyl-tRNA(Tyr) deacylase